MAPRPNRPIWTWCQNWRRPHSMKSVVRPELSTAAAGPSQAPTAAVDNSAPRSTHPEPTYKSGKTVQLTGTTYNILLDLALASNGAGATLDRSSSNQLYGVSAHDNNVGGISIDRGSINNRIYGSDASKNLDFGIELYGGCTGNIITNTNASGNGAYGYEFDYDLIDFND